VAGLDRRGARDRHRQGGGPHRDHRRHRRQHAGLDERDQGRDRLTRRTVDDLLAEARSRIVRLSPQEASAAAGDGALIVDIRSQDARERDGVVPGALHVPRTVLEWRADPASPWRNPELADLESRPILICDHGYSSSLAAASLVELGFARAGDVAGGFEAWRAAGLPVGACPPPAPGLPGMGPRD
jgi:rhodanese-related sulfurtransferase